MILPDVREAALEEVTQALEEVLRENSPLIAQRAENMVAIAIRHKVTIDHLLQWIHVQTPTKQWSASEWRRWCERFNELREQPQ